MGLIIIAMAATTSNGINKTVNSFETAVDALTIETPAQITQALQDLELVNFFGFENLENPSHSI